MNAPERYPTLTAYWRARVDALPPQTLPWPVGRQHDPAVRRIAVPEQTASAVAVAAAGHSLLAHTLLTTAVALTAAAWSGTDEAVLHTAPATGPHGTGGCLPLHLPTSGAPAIADLLSDCRAQLLAGYRRQAHRPHGHERCAIVVATTGVTTPACAAAGLAVTGRPHDGRLHTIELRAGGGWDEPTTDRFSAHLIATLHQLAHDPRRTPAALRQAAAATAALPTSQRHGPRHDWPATPVHELFDSLCAASPDAVAVLDGDGAHTYADLAKRSQAIADAVSAAAPPGTLVALGTDRTAHTIAAILGIRRAGCAYLPIETDSPEQRRHALLERARPGLHLPDPADPSPVALPDPATAADPDLFCVLPTSGSTGRPHLVEIGEAAVLNRLHWMWQQYPFGDGETLVLTKSTALVGSLWECFGGLLRGVPTVLADPADLIDPARLWSLLRRASVTRLHGSPTLLDILLHEAERRPADPLALRWCSSSAEPLSVALAGRWRRRFPQVPLLNLYGLTECTSNVAVHDTADAQPGDTDVPIGVPIANCGLHVLDGSGTPVPVGAVGHLHVSGAALARGYRGHDPRRTESFPVHGDLRLARTGDLARMRADGTFELLGRADNMIKIRGFRISPEEVEAAVRAHPGVTDAAVTTAGPADDRQLVAYVAPAGLDVDAIRERCRGALPAYMVPSAVIAADRLPRLPGGKLDRRGLPDQPGPAPAVPDHLTPPQRTVVLALHQVIGHIVALDTRLAALALSSLRMVRLHSLLHARAAHPLTVVDLFGCRTVGDIAAVLTGPATGGDRHTARAATGRAARAQLAARTRRRGEADGTG